MKKSENIAIRVSPPVKEALCRIAERGESLPPDCPEYPLRESAEGSANAQLATLIASVVPRARARSAEWADEYATTRFHKLWQKLEELDEPRLMNDAYELFTDGKRTPREQIRAMEFRLDTFLRAREAQQGAAVGGGGICGAAYDTAGRNHRGLSVPRSLANDDGGEELSQLPLDRLEPGSLALSFSAPSRPAWSMSCPSA